MIISREVQLYILFYSIFAGLLTGVLFDFYRIIRGFENPNRLITFIEDLLFWILSSMIVFTFLLITNYAYISIYIYLYIAVGLFIYLKTLSSFFIRIQYNVIKAIVKFIRILNNIIIYPFEILLNIKRK